VKADISIVTILGQKSCHSTIKNFVKEVLTEIKESVPEKEFIIGNINFEVTVLASSKKKGGIDLQIFQGELGGDNQVSHKISFSVSNKEASAHALKQLESIFTTLKKLDQPRTHRKKVMNKKK